MMANRGLIFRFLNFKIKQKIRASINFDARIFLFSSINLYLDFGILLLNELVELSFEGLLEFLLSLLSWSGLV